MVNSYFEIGSRWIHILGTMGINNAEKGFSSFSEFRAFGDKP